MIALIGLLTIIVLSIVVVRIAAVALELTGLSPDVAGFQAQSAFSGAGFTTTESESIMAHPVRRKVVRILIMFGSAGLTTTIATLILTFSTIDKGQDAFTRAGLLLAGLLIIFLFSRSELIKRFMKRAIIRSLRKRAKVAIYDYSEIFGMTQGYGISRFGVKRNSWLEGRPLKELGLHKEGTLLLSIHRKKRKVERFVGIPSGETTLIPGDILTIYGREEVTKCLSTRQKGEQGDELHQKRCEVDKKLKELREQELAD